MLLQTNSYIVPKDKRTEHARLVKRFKQAMARLGLSDFEVYEQTGPNWTTEQAGRFIQMMRFRDREHQKAVREAEKSDASAQDLVREFCELVKFEYQHQQGVATTGYYLGTGASSHTAALPAGVANSVNGSTLPPITEIADDAVGLDDESDDVKDSFHSAKNARAAANREVDD